MKINEFKEMYSLGGKGLSIQHLDGFPIGYTKFIEVFGGVMINESLLIYDYLGVDEPPLVMSDTIWKILSSLADDGSPADDGSGGEAYSGYTQEGIDKYGDQGISMKAMPPPAERQFCIGAAAEQWLFCNSNGIIGVLLNYCFIQTNAVLIDYICDYVSNPKNFLSNMAGITSTREISLSEVPVENSQVLVEFFDTRGLYDLD